MLYVTIACQALLAGVFVIAVAGKVRGRAAFGEYVASIAALGFVPWVRPAAYALLGAEILVAVSLATPAGLGAALLLLAVLTTGILLGLRRGRRVPCRCFGATAAPLGVTHVVRNLVLAGAAGAGLASGAFAGSAAADPAGVAVALVAAAAGVLVVVRLDDLVSLFK
ncbi:MauE/DoxX family redox-associated membrane protein [Nonomuraea typhae]|uniref:MauE/DoxX family redox-associated membrane protein n=1 Tax=Nonomuraea typhae TaxID=2603600 RepID=UPI0012F7E52F|nr:MauE/DoxX family redox-associated membrane protein [Nonomuraea typhae]